MTGLAGQLAGILRRRRGDESRRGLAARSGVSANALIHVETAAANPTLKRVEDLGATYGARLAIVDVDEVIEEFDTILRGKFGAADVPRRNARRRLEQFITNPPEGNQP